MKKELKGKTVYLEDVPAFLICEGGKKDPVTSTGWQYYREHTVEVDDWLENFARRGRRSPSGQLP